MSDGDTAVPSLDGNAGTASNSTGDAVPRATDEGVLEDTGETVAKPVGGIDALRAGHRCLCCCLCAWESTIAACEPAIVTCASVTDCALTAVSPPADLESVMVAVSLVAWAAPQLGPQKPHLSHLPVLPQICSVTCRLGGRNAEPPRGTENEEVDVCRHCLSVKFRDS